MLPPTPALAFVERADVVIQAGHEGRPESCLRFHVSACNLGAGGERTWTPIVADAAARVLRAHGLTVARLPADFAGSYRARAAVFIHFDGSATACSTGASIGYPDESADAASAWHALYGAWFPYAWMRDNFTVHEHHYYGFRRVTTETPNELLVELGELTCPAQRAWLAPRLDRIGELVAYFIAQRIGATDVPKPPLT